MRKFWDSQEEVEPEAVKLRVSSDSDLETRLTRDRVEEMCHGLLATLEHEKWSNVIQL